MLQICLMFAREKLDELKEKNIVHNFISHIVYMCDIGLVPSSIIREICRIISEHPTVTWNSFLLIVFIFSLDLCVQYV